MPIKPEHELILNELRTAASAITGVVEVLREYFSAPQKDVTPAAAGAAPETPKPVEVTLEAVRAMLSEISSAGKTDQARELIKKHGANKLTEIDPGKYAAVLADAKALANG
jgi:hypothetical protein